MKQSALYLLICLSALAGILSYRFLDMEHGWCWLIPFVCGVLGWYFVVLVFKTKK